MPKKNNKRRGSVQDSGKAPNTIPLDDSTASGETMEDIARPRCEHCALKVRKPEICGDPESWFLQLEAQFAQTLSEESKFRAAEKDIAEIGRQIMFLVTLLLKLLMYCYGGHKVMLQNHMISEAVYESKWYEASPEQRRDMLLVMIKTTKMEYLHFKIIDMSLETFLKSVRAGFSYLTMLKTMTGGRNN